jgi:hypothetical protein
MAPVSDVRNLVDAFLASEKRLAGVATWQPEPNDHGAQLIARPIEVAGELPGQSLVIKCYPREQHSKFRLILTMGRAIWRLDFTHDEVHPNPMNAPQDLPPIIDREPHFHGWPDNRRLATKNSLPKHLRYARLLSGRIKRFDQAFRWFCAETNIAVGPLDIPELPRADTLL